MQQITDVHARQFISAIDFMSSAAIIYPGAKLGYLRGMLSVEEVRLRNARVLVSASGGVTGFAEQLGISVSQASQIIGKKPVRRIGKQMARAIERAYKLTPNILDHDADAPLTSGVTPVSQCDVSFSRSVWEIAQAVTKLSPQKRNGLRALLDLPPIPTDDSAGDTGRRGHIASAAEGTSSGGRPRMPPKRHPV